MLVGFANHAQPQPHLPYVPPPTIYVYERQDWEYHVIVRRASDQEPLSQRELNELGSSGWELVGVITLADKVHFYFKRVAESTRSR